MPKIETIHPYPSCSFVIGPCSCEIKTNDRVKVNNKWYCHVASRDVCEECSTHWPRVLELV